MCTLKILIGILLLLTPVASFCQTASEQVPDSINTGTKKQDSFIVVETTAQFPGGIVKFYEYLSKNIEFPKSARKARVAGKVYVEFVINSDGSVEKESVRALEFPEALNDESCKAEAIRVIKGSPKWKPGERYGKPVSQRMVIPIEFKSSRQ